MMGLAIKGDWAVSKDHNDLQSYWRAIKGQIDNFDNWKRPLKLIDSGDYGSEY